MVDPGSYAYTGEWRRPFRATAAHNTVAVDGRDQCELWGDFRAAYPPSVRRAPLRRVGRAAVAAAAHDGYRRLSDSVEHHRCFVWLPGDGIVVVDRLRARRPHRIRSSLLLAPDAPMQGAERVGPFAVAALGAGANVVRGEAAYAPYLGRKVPAAALLDDRTVAPEALFGWSLLRGGGRVAELEHDRVVVTDGDRLAVTVPLPWA